MLLSLLHLPFSTAAPPTEELPSLAVGMLCIWSLQNTEDLLNYFIYSDENTCDSGQH